MMQVIETEYDLKVTRVVATLDGQGVAQAEVEITIQGSSETSGSMCAKGPASGSITLKTSDQKLMERLRPGFLFRLVPGMKPEPWKLMPLGATTVQFGGTPQPSPYQTT